MDFAESTQYLYSLGNEVSAMKLGLENIRTLFTALGDPQNKYLKVQVAGTNGKGSVCAFLNSICLETGVKTGLYTSPHLVSITERLKINGFDIGEDDFARVATIVRQMSEKLVADGKLESVPTFFEQITAIALKAFAEAKVDLAILETGLGGRLDATTAANAEIAAITRIDFDHQEYLGNTLAEIAGEKAAIIHAGTRAVIVGDQTPEAVNPIVERCGIFGVEIIDTESPETLVALNRLGFESYNVDSLGLAGRHQTENARIAILLARYLKSYFPISDHDIESGLENAHHPGRLEYIDRYLLDGAHNVGGAKALAKYLDEYITQPITLVFGAMKEKDIAEMAGILFEKADAIVLTRPDNSRALSPVEIAWAVPELIDQTKLHLTDTVGQALVKANEITVENGVILITGSLYLVGEAKKILNN